MSENYIFSDCCNAFTYDNDKHVYCTQCHRIIHTYNAEDEIVLDVIYNISDKNASNRKVASDLIDNQLRTASRLAGDVTLQDVDKTCPKCGGNPCKYMKDDNGKPFFICKCRNVFRDELEK